MQIPHQLDTRLINYGPNNLQLNLNENRAIFSTTVYVLRQF